MISVLSLQSPCCPNVILKANRWLRTWSCLHLSGGVGVYGLWVQQFGAGSTAFSTSIVGGLTIRLVFHKGVIYFLLFFLRFEFVLWNYILINLVVGISWKNPNYPSYDVEIWIFPEPINYQLIERKAMSYFPQMFASSTKKSLQMIDPFWLLSNFFSEDRQMILWICVVRYHTQCPYRLLTHFMISHFGIIDFCLLFPHRCKDILW